MIRASTTFVLGLLAVLPASAPAAGLQRFASCDALQQYAQKRAPAYDNFVITAPTTTAPATAAPVAAREGAEAGDQVSTTNNQEQDVDEADLVKATANRLYVIGENALLIIDTSGAEPKLASRTEIPGAEELLVRGDRALVVGGASMFTPGDDVVGPAIKTTVLARSAGEVVLTELDVSDAAKPEIRRSLTVKGNYETARLAGGVARVIIRSYPEAMDETQAQAAGLSRFLPTSKIESRLTGKTYERPVVPCRSVRRAIPYSGLGMTTVLTVEIGDGLQNVDRDAVLADPDTVYASAAGTYVATHRYVDGLETEDDIPAGSATEISRFVTSASGETEQRGSAKVAGYLLNQFSLSEYDGTLRVASTTTPTWLPDGAESRKSESRVTTFALGDRSLQRRGQVTGLGEDERIYAVRFLGELGYVVTFRQVDPLYVIDLSDPAAPKAVGELKIPGYSAYLHPVGDGRLLGIGADADARGRVTGAQVSLFDVSDPRSPKRLDSETWLNTYSAVESDHRAFLWWAPLDLAVVPMTGDSPFAQALTVSRNEITPGRKLPSLGWPDARSVVAGTRLFLLSSAGLRQFKLGTLEQTGELRY
ncbi:MAG: beta-propeller domain-containing protein [Baekduia sp.]